MAYVGKRSLAFALGGKWSGLAAIAAAVRDGLAGRGGERGAVPMLVSVDQPRP